MADTSMTFFFIFSGSEQLLIDFHNYLNATHPNIELSLEYSRAEINFLDLKITVDSQGSIHTSIYRKMSLMFDRFVQRGYEKSLLDQAVSKARSSDRKLLLKTKHPVNHNHLKSSCLHSMAT